jgi:PAS domain S-box-containing protein
MWVDITGRRQGEPAPRESESRYRAMVEALDGLIYICSPDYRVEFMNPQLIERTGYDGTGEYCYKVLHERNSICPWCVNEQVFRGETVRREVQGPEDHRWYYVVDTPIYRSDGRVSKQTVIQDITEFKQTEESLKQTHAELERRVEERTAHLKQANEQLLREIEERQQIEDHLRESEERFLAFMQHLPAGAIIRDLQGRYLFANKAWEKAFAKKWQGKTLEEIWPVDTAWHMRELDQKVIATGEPLETLVPLEQEDGPHTWLINWFPILGQDGRPVLVGSAGIDVTKRRQAEEALEAERQRLFSILDELPFYVYLQRPDHTVRFANRTFREHFGEPNENPCYEIFRGRSQPCEDCATGRVITTQSPQEAQCASPSGRIYQIYSYPFADVDGSLLALKLGVDITERLKAEEALYQEKEKYRILVEESPLGISIIGPTGEYKYLNPRFVEIFGYTLEDIPTGREWFARAHPDPHHRRNVISTWIKDLRESRPGEARLQTFTVTCKDGTEKIINFRPVSLESGSQMVIYEDITDRHRAQEALIESERRFGQLVEHAADELVLHDNGRIIEVNQQTCDDLGYSREELLKMTVFDLEAGISPQDLQKIWEQKTASPFTVRGVHRRKDGSTFPVEVRVARFIYGGRSLLLALARDITERLQAEEALRQSELRYRRLVVAAPLGISIIGPNGRYKYLNPKFEKMFGYTLDVIPTGREWFLKAFPDSSYREMVISDWKEEFKKPQLGEVIPRTFRVACKDGTTKVINFRAVTLVTGDRLMFYEDITQRVQAEEALKESEARYRLLAENVSDVIWTSDMNLKLSYVSPSAELLTGFSPKEVLKWGIDAILTPVSLKLARRIFAEEMLAERREPRDLNRSRIMEMELIRKDGSIAWTEVKTSFLRNEQRRPVGILGVARDISKRKKVELALRRREAILEAVSFAAEKFLQTESWEKDIQDILGRLGQSADASRVYIFENHLNDVGDLLTSQRYEWAGAGIEPQIDNLEMQNISWREAGFDRWQEQLSQGQIIVGHAREFPPSEQELLASQDIKSIVVVPIFAGPQWWGMIGLDECLNEREWSPVELEALKTAAGTLGAAILHERAEQALRKSEQKLRSLTAQLLSAQENERKRLAAELHDELGHALLTLKLSITSLEKQLTPEQASLTQEFMKIRRFIVETIKEVRRLYLDLSPGDLEDLGLTEALRDMIEDVASLQKKVKWSILLDNLDGLFPLPVQTAIYRVLQEALTNIGKHAKAKNVSIAAKRESHQITAIIEDDGRGFEASKVLDAKRSLGLLTMEERVKILGGTFTLWSQKKRGTRISFTIPFPEVG